MEPVSTAIIAALIAGAATGVKETVSKTMSDAYEGLKSFLRRRFGSDSRVVNAVADLEVQPASAGRQQVLREEVESSGASADLELVEAAHRLLGLVGGAPGGEQHVQQAIGNYIAQADRGGTAQVHVNTRDSGETQ